MASTQECAHLRFSKRWSIGSIGARNLFRFTVRIARDPGTNRLWPHLRGVKRTEVRAPKICYAHLKNFRLANRGWLRHSIPSYDHSTTTLLAAGVHSADRHGHRPGRAGVVSAVFHLHLSRGRSCAKGAGWFEYLRLGPVLSAGQQKGPGTHG